MMTSAQSASRWAALVLASGLLLALPAAPAFAASSSVTTIGSLQTALADCATAPNTITLAADISSTSTEITIPCTTTLNLGTFDLAVRTVSINSGVTFTVTGPTDGTEGTLTANASVSGAAGIAGIRNTDATFTVTGGKVVATARIGAAAIGGGRGQSAGALIISGGAVTAIGANNGGYGAGVGGGYLSGNGGTVTVSGGSLYASTNGTYDVTIGGGGAGPSGNGGRGADITVTGGTVTAVALGNNSTAIGGGFIGSASDRGGPGGSLVIGAGGEVVASSPRSAIGGGSTIYDPATVGDFGTVQVDGILRLPSGGLIVGTNPAVTNEIVVGATGRILGGTGNPAAGASISGSGQIANSGAITLAPPSTMVSGNNKLVQFDGGSAVRVFAPTFTAGSRTIPAPPAGEAWNTAADGSGSWFTSTSSTSGSAALNLYSVAPATLDVSTTPADLIATSGDSFTFPVTVDGTNGSPLSPQPTVTYTSSDCTIVNGNVFEVAGSCSITASVTVQGVALQTTFEIEVVPGALESLTITPSTDTVEQGESITFTVAGEDAQGNVVDVAAATLVSSVATDTVSGRVVAFSGAGSRAVTASLDGVSESATIEVVAGPLGELTITPDEQTVVQGDTVNFTITGADSAGNPVDAALAVLTSTRASDVVSGHSVTFSGSGSHVITASLNGISTTAAIEVTPGPLTELTIDPVTTTVAEGGSVEFTVTGEDSAGNPVDVSAAVLTSSATGDTVDALEVTFFGAGSRTVTATLGAVTTTATVDVVAGPLASLTISPSIDSVIEGDVIEFTLTGEDAAGNPRDVSAAVLTSSIGSDSITDHSVTFSGAGDHVITATLDGITTAADVEVAAGPLDSLTIIPSATRVDQGGTLSFTVTGEDAAGNPVDTSGVALTSSVATDVVTGLSVKFPHASPHTITATLGDVSQSVTIEVTPAASPAGLSSTGVDGGTSVLLGAGALVLLLGGGILLLARRSA